MSVNWRQSEICILIDDKSQGSIAKHLSWVGLLQYKCITHFVGKRIFKIGEHFFGEVTGKMANFVICPICLTVLFSKMQNSPNK